MCDPTATAGLMAFGAINSAMGAEQGASAAKAQAKQQSQSWAYQEQVSKNNAQIAQWQAQDALQQSMEQEIALRLKSAHLRSEQRVGYAASGVALDSESVINTMVSTDYMTEYDAATIKNNGLRAAWGYETQSNSYMDQAAAARYGADAYSARADSISPGKAVFSSLLGSAVNAAPGLYGMYKTGAFGGSSQFLNAGGGKNITAFDVKSRF